MESSEVIALAALGVSALAIVAGPLIAARLDRQRANLTERRRAYSEMLRVLRLRQREVHDRSMGAGTPPGEPEERDLQQTVTNMTLYASPKVWKMLQAFMMTYGVGGSPAMTAESARAKGDHDYQAHRHLGDLAHQLDVLLDEISDEMRKDLGLGRFFAKDRSRGPR